MGVLLRLLPLRPLRFTNSSSAATVGEQRPKPCMLSILDDLGFLIRRHEIFEFYYVSQQRYHERSLIRCMFRSRSYVDMRH